MRESSNLTSLSWLPLFNQVWLQPGSVRGQLAHQSGHHGRGPRSKEPRAWGVCPRLALGLRTDRPGVVRVRRHHDRVDDTHHRERERRERERDEFYVHKWDTEEGSDKRF